MIHAWALWVYHLGQLEKKLVKQQCFPHMSSQYDELRLTSGWDLLAGLGHPSKFQGYGCRRVLAALLHGTLVVGVSQTLRCWTQGANYIRQGGHHVGHWPTFLVYFIIHLYCFVKPKSASVDYNITSVECWSNCMFSHKLTRDSPGQCSYITPQVRLVYSSWLFDNIQQCYYIADVLFHTLSITANHSKHQSCV